MNSKEPRPVDLPSTDNWDRARIIAGPASLADRESWRASLQSWRRQSAARIDYDDSAYRNTAFLKNSSYSIALMWLWDELLFDFKEQKFTPEKLLADSLTFGGIDGIILWHAYPVIGVDSRNQFDYYNDVPGLSNLIAELQSAGVKIYLNYNPWDRWSKCEGCSDEEALARLVKRFDFDGVFLDTMKSAEPDFLKPIIEVKPDLIVAGESQVQQERISDHVMSWAQWFADSTPPGVLRAKFFEPRHMQHQTRRWNRSHIDELQIAWLNAAGMLVWEVVFGSWVGWNERDRTMWREMVATLRDNHGLITHGVWEPLTELAAPAEAANLFASKFSDGDHYLLTIINRSDHDYSGPLAYGLSGSVPAWGVAAITHSPDLHTLIEFTYADKTTEFPIRINQREEPLVGTPTLLSYTYRNREAGLYDGAPFIDAWKPLPPNFHQIFTREITVPVQHGELDTYEVSNLEFFEFVQATNYQPEISHRFLAHWVSGTPTVEQYGQAVTFIDLSDATAYAIWKGCQIPNEWEWQVNAIGMQRRNPEVWNLTNSIHSDGRTRFLILKGGAHYNAKSGQGAKSASGIAESDWYIDGGIKDVKWVEKLLLMGLGMSRSENIGFRCFYPLKGK